MAARLPALLLPALAAAVLSATPRAQDASPQKLSQEEIAAGWHVLFDGQDTDSWRGYRRDSFPDRGWEIVDGALHLRKGGGGGDIITRRRYRNFELALQWKVAPGANSGIMYRVAEGDGASYFTGPEYQVIDDAGHEDSAGADWSAGALYGLYAPPKDKVLHATGEWNDTRIVVHGNAIEHWLNGRQVVAAELGSDDWKKRVANSKFDAWKDFARIARGHICLQDHGDAAWYRNIRIRELAPTAERLGGAVVLFDGSGMDAWSAHLKGEAVLADVWSITDGVLVCTGKPAGYIYTNESFKNFVLRLQWRFNPVTKKAGNSGVLLRMTGEHKVWPRSIEAQLMSGNAGDFWNIGKFPMQVVAKRTRGRNTKKTKPNEKPIGEWNEYEIIVDDGWVSLRVNGEVLNEAWDCEEIAGKLCLQSEGAEIHFRDVRLFPLK